VARERLHHVEMGTRIGTASDDSGVIFEKSDTLDP
jgi:hypothetical protein